MEWLGYEERMKLTGILKKIMKGGARRQRRLHPQLFEFSLFIGELTFRQTLIKNYVFTRYIQQNSMNKYR